MDNMNIDKIKNEAEVLDVTGNMAISRESKEVQVAMMSAKYFPRDEVLAWNRAIKSCKKMSLATRAIYEYPRGKTKVSGPSIHLVKEIARQWGNIDSGFKILEQTEKESMVMAYCWDLETNYRETRVFNVKHIRETKQGAYPMTDLRDIYELVANHASRRERACILSVLPSDLVDEAVKQCKKTMSSENDVQISDIIKNMVRIFEEEYGVTVNFLESYIGHKKENFSKEDIMNLRNVYNALRDGNTTTDEVFNISLKKSVEDKTQKKSLDDIIK